MTSDAAMARRRSRGQKALKAYEQTAFPSEPSLLQHDGRYAQALLGALMCDLEHYARSQRIDFSAAVTTGHAINLEESAEAYKIGDQVRLDRHEGRCGTIIGWHTADQTCFLIDVPGLPTYAEPAAHLSPAPPFPQVNTSLGMVTRADQAECAYLQLTTRPPLPLMPSELDGERRALLTSLSAWSGVPETRLLQELAPAAPQRPLAAGSAIADFPHDIGTGIPPSPGSTRTSCQPSPRSGPTQSA